MGLCFLQLPHFFVIDNNTTKARSNTYQKETIYLLEWMDQQDHMMLITTSGGRGFCKEELGAIYCSTVEVDGSTWHPTSMTWSLRPLVSLLEGGELVHGAYKVFMCEARTPSVTIVVAVVLDRLSISSPRVWTT